MEFRKSSPLRKTLTITPLIDLVFLLLIFFMLTTNFTEKESIEMVFSDNNQDTTEPGKDIVITVINNRVILLDNREIASDLLKKELENVLKSNSASKFVVKSGKYAAIQDIITVMDEIRLAGANKVILSEN